MQLELRKIGMCTYFDERMKAGSGEGCRRGSEPARLTRPRQTGVKRGRLGRKTEKKQE